MASEGVVRIHVPCIRDVAWQPNQRAIDRLGLAPSDTAALKEAYERSNKRVTEQLRPLCAKALGNPDAFDAVGAGGCMDAITNTSKKANAGAAKDALSRVAEVQAGKRAAPKDLAGAPPLEQLGLLLTGESKAFEQDLAQKLGPEEARRLASAPELCSERRTLRTTERDDRQP